MNLAIEKKTITKFIAKRKGIDNTELTKDFDIETKQMIASCSKWLSAALVMTFVDEGKLSLNDSIGKYLPVMKENGKGGIQIWQCLSHLTGIKPGNFKESLEMINKAPSMDEAMNAIALQPMEGAAGKTFHYSNVGLQIASAIIEKISGTDFKTLFEERIAKPCNMLNTDWGNGKTILAAGSARSTPTDYIHFLQMILHEGIYNGKQVLSKSSITEMQKNRKPNDVVIKGSPAEAGDWGYGFGEWVADDATGETRSKSVTSPGMFGSFPWVNYENNTCGFLFVVNMQNKDRNKKYKELKKIVDEAIAK